MTQAADILIRPMEPGEEDAVHSLVAGCFNSFIAPGYSQEGVDKFYEYVQPECIRLRSGDGHFLLVAVADGVIAGIIEVRNYDHVSLFFVDERCQGQGVGRSLFEAALELCRGHDPALASLTVNSSPYAVPVYGKLGFRPVEPEKVVNGIRFTPMKLDLV